MFDVQTIKKDFPGLSREINGHKITFLDSGASSQTPTRVLDVMNDAYNNFYANVHRGVYTTAQEISNAYENSRKVVAKHINAWSPNEVIYVRNATEAINLVARSWGDDNISEGGVILLSHLEHHANIVPWQQLAHRTGAVLRYIPLDDETQLDLTDFDSLIEGVKLLAITAASNVTGTVVDVKSLTERAHKAGAKVLVDACQYIPHFKTDVQDWDADFVAFSAHKMLGPTGIGALWAKEDLLNEMPPFLGGGSMITDVTLDDFEPAELPAKFEAGTPAFIEAIGFAEAFKYLDEIGFDNIAKHEQEITKYALSKFEENFADTITVHGPNSFENRLAIFSLSVEGVHPHDVSQILDEYGVCVRAGHHCAKPLMRVLKVGDQVGIGATSRASAYVYNDDSDIDKLCEALQNCITFFK